MEQKQLQMYLKGFNNGYLLAKHEPVLLASIVTKLTPSNDYLSGFLSGKEQLKYEIDQKHLEDLNHLRAQNRDRNQEREL